MKKILLSITFLAFVNIAIAGITYVSLAGLHVAPYDSWANAAKDIQSAVDATSLSGMVI